jgi:hypothetical protein
MPEYTPQEIARGTWAHFKPLVIIVGVLLAVVGPALFFHGPAFWGAMFAWWAFLGLVATVAYQVWIRKSGRAKKPPSGISTSR